MPAAPKKTGPAGRRLWRSVLEAYELDEHELTLLRRACRTADTVDALQAVVDDEGMTVKSRLGEPKIHPALVELRNQSVLLSRLIVALRVPLGEEQEQEQEASPRPSPRGQVRSLRGTYSPRGGAA